MKRLLSENKVLVVLALIIIVALITMGIALVSYFYGGNGKDVYGTRLTGIEDVPISNDIKNKVLEALGEGESIGEVVVNVKGKVIYVNVDFKKNESLVDAQSLVLKSLDAFSEEEKAFYDIQLIVTANTLEEEVSTYPFMGYKNSKSTKVIWTNSK